MLRKRSSMLILLFIRNIFQLLFSTKLCDDLVSILNKATIAVNDNNNYLKICCVDGHKLNKHRLGRISLGQHLQSKPMDHGRQNEIFYVYSKKIDELSS